VLKVVQVVLEFSIVLMEQLYTGQAVVVADHILMAQVAEMVASVVVVVADQTVDLQASVVVQH
jgi:hypothetical protein